MCRDSLCEFRVMTAVEGVSPLHAQSMTSWSTLHNLQHMSYRLSLQFMSSGAAVKNRRFGWLLPAGDQARRIARRSGSLRGEGLGSVGRAVAARALAAHGGTWI